MTYTFLLGREGKEMDVAALRVDMATLEGLCAAVFESQGLSAEDARISAEVLVAADARGIPSHGVARLGRYVEGLGSGLMQAKAIPETVSETSSSLVIDAKGSMGAPISLRTMRRTIDKARVTGVAFAAVRDSNHFGIAGYYAKQALAADMLGIAMTNTAALGVLSHTALFHHECRFVTFHHLLFIQCHVSFGTFFHAFFLYVFARFFKVVFH
ncbi:MAG: Ldh family oxidoreductase, partial [Spirochaetota bacterium]